MTHPFRPLVLEQVMVHVNDFVRAVVERPDHNRPICVEIGLLLERFIARGVAIEPINEE